MTRYGYTLYCEGTDPKELIRQAVLAEKAGFDFLVISDHYHPWLPNQEHSAFAWSVLGAVAQATKSIRLATMVTCPTIRYHPAIVAQMAATIAVISDGRFTLGLGAGERLNEHVVGVGWPSSTVRNDMLHEAILIILKLWQGEYFTYDGRYFTVEDAKVFDLPIDPIDYFVAASGPTSAMVAAEAGGGICITEPSRSVIDTFARAKGDAQRTWGQLVTSWAPDEKQGLQHAYDQFRFTAGGWKVQAELPNPVNFEAATKTVRPEDLAEAIPSGPDVEKHFDAIRKYLGAGVYNLALAYPGDDVDGFMKFWSKELKPKLQ